MDRLLLSMICLFASACAHRPPQHEGDAQGKARIEALPSLDVESNTLTDQMRFAVEISKESLGLTLPDFRNAGARAAWTDATLKQWLRDKQSATAAAGQALDTAAAQSGRQRIMAGALGGLVFEEAARDLLEVPPPTDLPLDLETVAVFREIMQKNASVCLQTARKAYQACAENAPGLEGMAHWAPFCTTRAQGLPTPHDPLSVE
jgi:hypothetical protein